MKSIGIVVVEGGVAEVFQPEHVDIRIVDLDDVREGTDGPVKLPAGVGFEELAKEAGLDATSVIFGDEDVPETPADWPESEEKITSVDHLERRFQETL